MQRPKPTNGLRHVALYTKHLEACEHFYTELVGMKVVWKPDPDNIYLSTGSDNFALHRAPHDFTANKHQRLDHIGFFLNEREAVDHWHDFLRANDILIQAAPKDHRDGTRSFYCLDPEGTVVQFIYYPILDPV